MPARTDRVIRKRQSAHKWICCCHDGRLQRRAKRQVEIASMPRLGDKVGVGPGPSTRRDHLTSEKCKREAVLYEGVTSRG